MVKFTLHQIGNQDPDDKWRGYAIMPDDGTGGFLVGDTASIHALAKRLNRFLENERHDGKIPSLDERLGWQWMSIAQAVEFARDQNIPIAASTIRMACTSKKISDAKLEGKTWRFPRATFMGWLKRSTHQRGRPKQRE